MSHSAPTRNWNLMSEKALSGKLVALSVSENEDLGSRGFSGEHINRLCLRISRMLLRAGAGIAYGGVMGTGSLTKIFHSAALRELDWTPLDDESEIHRTPFVNYQPWPWYLDLPEEPRDRDRRCTYRFVSYCAEEQAARSGDEIKDSRDSAHASSRMRRWMAEDCDARVIIGGKATGFAGVMPGILEEALFHLELDKPLYVVGRFGGAAAALADAFLQQDEDTDLPRCLIEDHREGKEKLEHLLPGFPTELGTLVHDVTRHEAETSYDRLHKQIVRIRESALEEGTLNGLKRDENIALMGSQSPHEIATVIARALGSS